MTDFGIGDNVLYRATPLDYFHGKIGYISLDPNDNSKLVYSIKLTDKNNKLINCYKKEIIPVNQGDKRYSLRLHRKSKYGVGDIVQTLGGSVYSIAKVLVENDDFIYHLRGFDNYVDFHTFEDHITPCKLTHGTISLDKEADSKLDLYTVNEISKKLQNQYRTLDNSPEEILKMFFAWSDGFKDGRG